MNAPAKGDPLFDLYNHLSFTAPFYFFNTEDKIVADSNFGSVVHNYPGRKYIDIPAVIEVLSKRHPMGDRILIKGINRSPWMAKPNPGYTGWDFADLPPHGEKILDDKEIAKEFFDAVCNEITGCIGDKKNIAVLLSGGMDSRIAAGIVDYLIKNGVLKGVKVTALTWGNQNSRDVVYSRRIADLLGWDWKHYLVDAGQMKYNIEVSALNGCEYSALHLHAIPLIRDENIFDCVLAASYGDSVGRAEYSGIKVTNLRSLKGGYSNFGGILKQEVYKKYCGECARDFDVYHSRFPRQKKYQQFELDYQLHYMRRMLNPCMEVIGRKMPLYQVFTHPGVFGLMWGLSPAKRTDDIYGIIMGLLDERLSKIPWARTGLLYGEATGVPDLYKKAHHNYSQIICSEIFEEIKNAVLSDQMKSLGIFNMAAIQSILKKIDNKPGYNFDYVERILWLASFSKMLQLYELDCSDMPKSLVTRENSIQDVINSTFLTPLEYKAKYYYRKFNR